MKPMNKKITAITLSALLATAAGGAMAFGGHHERHGECDHRSMSTPMHAIARLDGLTDEQKTQLKQIRRETRDAMRGIRDEMQDVKDALRDAMADNASIDNIQVLAKKQGDQIAKMIVLRAESRDRIKHVLTDEQKAQLDAMRKSGDGFRGHQGRMGF